MKLTSYTNYAMRSLQLAALKSPDLVRIDDVAQIHNLSRPHIMKIVHELGKAGYLETVRGRNGGFRLARPPEEIIVGEVVRITEGPLDVVECFNPEKNTCPLMGICILSRKMQEATAVCPFRWSPINVRHGAGYSQSSQKDFQDPSLAVPHSHHGSHAHVGI